MEKWQKSIIKEKIVALKQEEKRQFLIAYGELEEKYHGYLISLPQNVTIWHTEVDDEHLKELKKEFGWDRVSCFAPNKKEKEKKKTFYKTDQPYLGVDGHLAMANDKYEKFTVELTLVSADIIKAVVTTERGVTHGIAKIVRDNLDKATGAAIRKALTYTGGGRFPIHSTPYGEDKTIKEFREFKKGKK